MSTFGPTGPEDASDRGGATFGDVAASPRANNLNVNILVFGNVLVLFKVASTHHTYVLEFFWSNLLGFLTLIFSMLHIHDVF